VLTTTRYSSYRPAVGVAAVEAAEVEKPTRIEEAAVVEQSAEIVEAGVEPAGIDEIMRAPHNG
jgi:hypothetical protein